jgi:HK97 family phage major capsid protein
MQHNYQESNTQMNIETRERELKARAAKLQNRASVIKTMTAAERKQFDRDLTAWENDANALKADKDDHRIKALRFGMDDDYQPNFQKKTLGREANPMAFSEESLRAVHKAMQDGQNIRVKAFSTVDSLLPAQLHPNVIGKIHEHRLMDRLPITPMSAPSLTFLVHSSNTGGPPAITAEGATKPDITLNFTSSTIQAQKIASTFGISWESQLDFPGLISYAQGEIFKQTIDAENSALINGSSGIVGFQQTSGILTLAYSTGSYLDTFSQAIENLRVGSALADADLIVMHPGTFGAIRRQKDGQSRYLLNPDPTRDEANNIWGVEVLQTTAINAGTALVMDTQKFGFVALRSGLEIFSGYTNDDFQRNISRWAIEERLNLACERPSAVLNITNLPVS